MSTTHTLAKRSPSTDERPLGDTTFCDFTPKGDDAVRVVTYGTHTAYISDFTVTREEARALWRNLRAKGYGASA